MNVEKFFYRAPLRNFLFHVQVAEFQTAPDTVKSYFRGAFQAFYTGVHLLKIPENYL